MPFARPSGPETASWGVREGSPSPCAVARERLLWGVFSAGKLVLSGEGDAPPSPNAFFERLDVPFESFASLEERKDLKKSDMGAIVWWLMGVDGHEERGQQDSVCLASRGVDLEKWARVGSARCRQRAVKSAVNMESKAVDVDFKREMDFDPDSNSGGVNEAHHTAQHKQTHKGLVRSIYHSA